MAADSKPNFAELIETKLRDAFAPTVLDVVNESSMHNVPKGSQTHFKVVVVAEAFEGKSQVARHQLVFRALDGEIRPGRIHALSIVSRTPAEWAESPAVPPSPECEGGSKR